MVSASIKEANKIRNRHQVVSYLKENQEVLQKTQNQIKQISDLERLISKIAAGKFRLEVVIFEGIFRHIIPIKTLALESKQGLLK
jgi:DNA mismatch repair protein MutS